MGKAVPSVSTRLGEVMSLALSLSWDVRLLLLTWPLSFCRLGLHDFCKITCIWSSDCTVPVKATLLSCSVDATSPSFRTSDLCPTLFSLTLPLNKLIYTCGG